MANKCKICKCVFDGNNILNSEEEKFTIIEKTDFLNDLCPKCKKNKNLEDIKKELDNTVKIILEAIDKDFNGCDKINYIIFTPKCVEVNFNYNNSTIHIKC